MNGIKPVKSIKSIHADVTVFLFQACIGNNLKKGIMIQNSLNPKKLDLFRIRHKVDFEPGISSRSHT